MPDGEGHGPVNWSWDVDYDNGEENAARGVTEPIQSRCYRVPDDQLRRRPAATLSVDNPVVVPVDTFVRVQVTAEGDAIHAFAMPAFGLKVDAVPGRLNETYFKAEREGHLLRPVLGALRQGPRLHADRDPGRLAGRVPRMGGDGGDAISPAAPTRRSRRRRQPSR